MYIHTKDNTTVVLERCVPYFLEIWPAAKLNFKALYHAGTIRGHSTEINTHAYTASLISPFVCMYNVCVLTYIVVDPVPCGEISKAAFIGMSWLKYAATFKGGRISRCEEIQYTTFILI